MPSVAPSGNSSSSDRVLPSSMWPAHPDTYRDAVKFHDAAVAARREKARGHRSTAHQLVTGGEGEFIDAAAEKYQVQANAEDILGDVAAANGGVARTAWRLSCALTQELENIDALAQQSLSSSPTVLHPGIRADAIAAATETIARYTTDVSTAYTCTEADSATKYETLGLHPDGSEKDTTTKALDHSQPRRDENSSTDNTDTRKTSPGNNTSSESNGRAQDRRNNVASGTESANDAPPTAGSSPGSFAQSQRSEILGGGAPSPSRGSSPNLSTAVPGTSGLGGGGVPSGGGLGSGGLGSNPLSSLTSGVGKVPSTSGLTPAGGSSALPTTSGVGPAAVDPASFGRAVSAGSAAAGITSSPVAPAPPLAGPSTAAVTPGVGSSPVSGPSAVPAGLAGSGQHVPTSGPAMPAPGMGASGAGGMLMPPPGLGAPAATGGVVSTPASVSTPAATAPSVSSSAGGGSATAGSTLIPAGVATPVAVTRGVGKSLSVDVLSAAALTWELAQAGDLQKYPMDWAVGVFRSPTGSETVVMSGDGWGYVPVGVFLPRSARLLVSDPLAGDAFRDVWFGWADPARIMVEYAKLRVDGGWKLVAAATTGPANAFREAGVDHTVVNRDKDARPKGYPSDWAPPDLDRQHQHRLELGHPDLFERLEKLNDVGRRYQERVIYPLCAALMSCLVGVDEIPQLLRSGWHLVSCGRDLDAPAWAEFVSACNEKFAMVGAKRPGGFWLPDTAEHPQPRHPQDVPVSIHQHYRGQWVLARAMEQFSGWAAAPMPLSDMVYAAMAAERIDVRAVLEEPLRTVEEECG